MKREVVDGEASNFIREIWRARVLYGEYRIE